MLKQFLNISYFCFRVAMTNFVKSKKYTTNSFRIPCSMNKVVKIIVAILEPRNLHEK